MFNPGPYLDRGHPSQSWHLHGKRSKLLAWYNRQSIPRIPNDEFYKLLTEVPPTYDDFELEVKRIMAERSAQFHSKFEEQAYDLMLSGPKLFEDQSKQFTFFSAMCEPHTIQGFEKFISDCVPELMLTRKTSGAKKKSKGVSKPSTKLTGGPRRSLRIQKPKTTSK